MFCSKKIFTYTPDKQLTLRQAAALGDLTMVESLLKEDIDINQTGPGTKRSALHQACIKNHEDIAIILATHGGDIDAQDFEQKSALSYCYQNGNASLALTLKLIRDSKKANELAITVLPVDGWRLTESQITERSEYRKNAGVIFYQLLYKYNKNRQSAPMPKTGLEQAMLCDNYIMFLIEIQAYLLQIKAQQYKLGSCGERSRLAHAWLSNHLQQTYDTTLSLEWVRIEQGDSRYNHVFLVLNRPADSDLVNPASWKNAIICDPLTNEVYLAKHAKIHSAVAETYKATKVCGFTTTQTVMDKVTPESAANFYNDTIKQLIQENNQIVQALFPELAEAGQESYQTSTETSCSSSCP